MSYQLQEVLRRIPKYSLNDKSAVTVKQNAFPGRQQPCKHLREEDRKNNRFLQKRFRRRQLSNVVPGLAVRDALQVAGRNDACQ